MTGSNGVSTDNPKCGEGALQKMRTIEKPRLLGEQQSLGAFGIVVSIQTDSSTLDNETPAELLKPRALKFRARVTISTGTPTRTSCAGSGCGSRDCGIFDCWPDCGFFGCDGGCSVFGRGGGCGPFGCIGGCPLDICFTLSNHNEYFLQSRVTS